MVKKEPIRQLIKFSNYSLCITLPKEYIDNLGWQQGDRISFELSKNKTNLVLSRESVIVKSEEIKKPAGTEEIPKEESKPLDPSPNNIPEIVYTEESIVFNTPLISNEIIAEKQFAKSIPSQENFDSLEPIPPLA